MGGQNRPAPRTPTPGEEKLTLHSLQGDWFSNTGSHWTIKASGEVLQGGKVVPETAHFFEERGVIQRKDGYKVNMKKSSPTLLIFEEKDGKVIEWYKGLSLRALQGDWRS